MKEYYVPVQSSCESIVLGLYKTEEEAQQAYLKYLEKSAKTPEKFKEKFEKLKYDYQIKFKKELDLQQLQSLIFLEMENLTNEEFEKLEEQHDWLLEIGIGCTIEWYKAGDLFEFGNYTGWKNIKGLYNICRGIHCDLGYNDQVSYVSRWYPNLYFCVN